MKTVEHASVMEVAMNRACSVSYVCGGILCLALAAHLAAQSATAQAGAQVSGYSGMTRDDHFVMTPTGDVYYQHGFAGPPSHVGNFWAGAPTPAARTTWGGVKARYRPGATARDN